MAYPIFEQREPDDSLTEPAVAIDAAGCASEAWADAVRRQRWNFRPDHSDFYALAGEVVSTVAHLGELVAILRAQVATYASTPRLYDDTHAIRPTERIDAALASLASLKDDLAIAGTEADEFQSAIGHIGVES